MDELVPSGELLSSSDVSRMLRLSQTRIRSMVKQGLLRSVQLGPRGHHRFTREEVERLVRDSRRP